MGKRSRERMTGLDGEQRVQRSEERRIEEERRRRKLAKLLTKEFAKQVAARRAILLPALLTSAGPKITVRHKDLPERVTLEKRKSDQ